jgi:NAD(P)H dehydrogenase (quinone)
VSTRKASGGAPIVVAGATGKLGRLAVDALIRRGVDPSDILAAGRNPERLAEHTAKGVRTARIELDEPATLRAAFAGAQKVLLVSVPGNPQRLAQHRRVVDAAKAAGVELFAYTSWVHADANDLHPEHHATERAIADSGLPHVILRNGAYLEFHASWIPFWLGQGRVLGAADDGRISGASRSDLADAAAVVLTTPGHAGETYELGSDAPFTLAELAQELSRQAKRSIPYDNLSAEGLQAHLVSVGFAERVAAHLAKTDRAIASGDLFIDTGDLQRLVARPLVDLTRAVESELAHPAGQPLLPPDRPPEQAGE